MNGNFTLKFYICFQASCFVSKIFQTVREWGIKKVREKKRRKETSILEQYTRLADYFAHPRLLFHLNKSHEIKRSSPSDISKLIVKLCITTLINGANYLSGSQKSVTG